MQQLRWKLILIALVTALFAFLAFSQEVRLGLDLRGGIHLVLRVEVEEAVRSEVRDDVEAFVRLLEEDGVTVSATAFGEQDALVTLVDAAELQRAVALAKDNFPSYEVAPEGEGGLRLTLTQQARQSVEDGAVRQALQTIRNRIDEYGVSEPVIQRQGLNGDRILVQLPGVENPERVKRLLRNTALLELKLVIAGPAASRQELLDQYDGTLPVGSEILETAAQICGGLEPELRAGWAESPSSSTARSVPLRSSRNASPRPRRRSPAASRCRRPRTSRWCCAPARCRPRSTTSRNARWAPRSARSRSIAGARRRSSG